MKDLLLCVHVVIETLNLEISARCHLPDHVKELYERVCRACSMIIYFLSTNQIIASVVAAASALLPIVSTLYACDREMSSNYPEIRSLSAVWR